MSSPEAVGKCVDSHLYDPASVFRLEWRFLFLQYAPTTQNNRVAALSLASEENQRSLQMDISMDADNITTVIESAYRQIFFHAFKSDRDSLPRITTARTARSPFVISFADSVSRTPSSGRFYGLNSNYKVVRHLVEKVLGRKTHGQSEEISWSIVIASQGMRRHGRCPA